MAAGDYIIRGNASNTDEIPATGSDLLLQWPTAIANVGSGITHSNGIITLGETGHFLVMCSDHAHVVDNTNNERINYKMTLTLAGVELVEGYSTAYMRKNNSLLLDYLTYSAAIIEVTTTTGNGDELEVRSERTDDVVITGPVRVVNDRVGITIIKLDDAWDYGRYQSSAVRASSATDNTRVVMNLQTQDEQDASFIRTTDTIEIDAVDDLVLAVYSVKTEAGSGTTRREFQSNLFLNGSAVDGSWNQQYMRSNENTFWTGSSNVVLLNPTAGWNLDVGVVTREGGGINFDVALQLVRLPAAAEAIIVASAAGNFNPTAATNFNWPNAAAYDPSTAFTFSSGQTNIDVDNAGDYIVMAGQAYVADAVLAVTRTMPALQFRVNTTDVEHVGHSTYNRNSGTAGHGALSCATLLDGLSAADSIHCRNDRLGPDTGAMTNGAGAFAVIRLSSLFGAAGEFPLNVDPAAFVLTGLLAAPDIGMPVLPGSFILTGVETGPEEFGFAALPGTITLTGVAATVVGDMLVDALPDTFILTGVAATLEFLVMDQEGFRWRNDDGTEITATWRRLQDVKDSVDKAVLVRLRLLLDSMGDQPSLAWRIEYKESADPDIEYRKVEVE